MEAGAWLRAARRSRRVSQRELAALAGCVPSKVGRIESGANIPRVDTVVGLLSVLGYQLAIVDHRGRLLDYDQDHDRLRDRGDRHFPAHLDAASTPGYFEQGGRTWWGWHHVAWPFGPGKPPEHTYWRRPAPPGSGTWGFLDEIPEPWEDAT
jgi:transcriptional regulator with XRE-family HTH domain